MVTKTRIAGLLMALTALSAPLVYADNGAGDMRSWHQAGPREHLPSIAKVLGLSDDQVKQLKDLHDKQKTAMKGVFDQIKANREALNTEIVKAPVDMNKVNELQTQFKALQARGLLEPDFECIHAPTRGAWLRFSLNAPWQEL